MTAHVFGHFIHGSSYVDYCFYVDYCITRSFSLTERKKSNKKLQASIFHGKATTNMLKGTH